VQYFGVVKVKSIWQTIPLKDLSLRVPGFVKQINCQVKEPEPKLHCLMTADFKELCKLVSDKVDSLNDIVFIGTHI
jgi:hypothetical protein